MNYSGIFPNMENMKDDPTFTLEYNLNLLVNLYTN